MNRQSSNRVNDSLVGHARTRFNRKRGTYRLRFTAMHEDQLETVFAALQRARTVAGTKYDSVALEMICLEYLAGGSFRCAINCKSPLPR